MAQQPKTRAEFEKELILKAWKDPAFREELIANPKRVVEREIQALKADVTLPEDLEVVVLEETAKKIYLVLPPHPGEMTGQEISDEALDAVAGGTAVVATITTQVYESQVQVVQVQEIAPQAVVGPAVVTVSQVAAAGT